MNARLVGPPEPVWTLLEMRKIYCHVRESNNDYSVVKLMRKVDSNLTPMCITNLCVMIRVPKDFHIRPIMFLKLHNRFVRHVAGSTDSCQHR